MSRLYGWIVTTWLLLIAVRQNTASHWSTTYGKHDHSTLTSDALDVVFCRTTIDTPVGELQYTISPTVMAHDGLLLLALVALVGKLQSTMSRHYGSLQSALNTCQKFDRESL